MPSEKRVQRRLADGTVKTYTYAASTPRADAVWTLGRLIASYRRYTIPQRRQSLARWVCPNFAQPVPRLFTSPRRP